MNRLCQETEQEEALLLILYRMLQIISAPRINANMFTIRAPVRLSTILTVMYTKA